jgi:hypothetical protein
MNNQGFVAYVGDPDIHDGYVRAVTSSLQKTSVTVEGASGQWFVIEFDEVAWVKSQRPEGMMLYALTEYQGEGTIRRFIFANWDEEDDAFLEIGAVGFQIAKQPGSRQAHTNS